ncbi:MAG: CocE/NonD family hydrolase [Haliangiales bacterium]
MFLLSTLLGAACIGCTATPYEPAPADGDYKRADFDAAADFALASLDDGVRFRDDVSFMSGDGTALTGNVFEPASDGSLAPAVVFVNSWALNEYEYLVPAAALAERGYIVLSYNTRGFGTSEGLINVAGPDDMADLRAALDWLEANTAVDVERIGMAGISYGAGISLLGLAQEPRVKTAVAMSGWADLGDSLYKAETPRLAWGLILLGSGYFTGRMDPIIAQQFENLLSNESVADTLAWASERSPATFIDNLNEAGKPVYLSSNLSDTLFNPNQMLDFFERLSVPKRLDLNQGTHATAELLGLLGFSNYVWDNAYDWFDFWLRDQDNGVLDQPQVTIEKKFSHERLGLSEWPAPGSVSERFYLTPRFLLDGGLSTAPNQTTRTNTVITGVDTVATTGIPVLSELLESSVDVPVLASIPAVNGLHGLSFWSDFVSDGLEIVGRPQLSLRLRSSADTAHVNVYLYDVNLFGVGTLITHGSASLHDIAPDQLQTIEVDLNATAYDLPAGHRVAVVIDGFDLQYANRMPFGTTLDFPYQASSQMVLDIPAL